MTSPSDFSLAANPGKLSKPASRVARQDRAMDRITPPKSYIPKLGALVVGVNLTSCGAWCKRHYGVVTPIGAVPGFSGLSGRNTADYAATKVCRFWSDAGEHGRRHDCSMITIGRFSRRG